jgi:hypothetical protein
MTLDKKAKWNWLDWLLYYAVAIPLCALFTALCYWAWMKMAGH